ncbi:uncharacterized protein BX663DRAFT_518675 [Cokeromyces recurvatus]|uniref:uncharacterized protein n=1 Tax=Cokeromyces recurvatus TaxID=90255 RepID=UPI00221E57D4|nr:uncharacterized protein BX663DRAFT_522494 [Cokeromyces recurvatus]XP_051380116.1 uncharacterized protein BX663DRAFT_518675 [Cokeromyces recurvatus]KAI7899155.1 hypothetical protein BX663DRAFT_522494 [Cokeromyces recurvatus]KAI7900131.1 hypothetical protein BX663DRAFT_518675 [Cokeromyces recurvatus]
MDRLQTFSSQFNPQIYESSNVPPSTDKLFSFSGFQAGLMTNNVQQSSSSQQNHFPPHHPLVSSQIQHPFTLPQSSQFQSLFSSSNIMDTMSNNMDNNNGRYAGIYTNTGFDMLSILSRVVNRSNPQIYLGPIDLSCSFVVVDAKQYDFPLVYSSPMFERLTGYASHEVIGQNCRFLQAPDGQVAIGSRRKYTDNTTIYHIKTHMIQGKESQCSIINYRKTGQPFVNLLTVIPITAFDSSDEIDYFVGLQVDLVEQPNAIFQSMKDGTYIVNYRNSTIPPSIFNYCPDKNNTDNIEIEEWYRPNTDQNRLTPQLLCNTTQQNTISSNMVNSDIPSFNTQNNQSHVITPSKDLIESPIIDIETLIKEASTGEGKYRKYWHELLLEEAPDFVHVLTIKGVFLFCSESTKALLEYDPSELVGKSLKSVCHPSDITTVMRELKQASTSQPSTPIVNLIYRIRRKHSGYIWFECYGKLCNEDGKGRKYVVISGRERPVYRLSRAALALGNKTHNQQQGAHDGTEDHEFWGKLSLDGLLLYISWTNLTRALAEVKEGKIVYLKHALLNNEGMEVMVATTFYPDGFTSINSAAQPTFVLMQTKAIDYETALMDDKPVFISLDPDIKKKGKADDREDQRSSREIEELEVYRDASWQYELHQLRISNNKLREELSSLLQKNEKEGNEEIATCHTCFRRLPGLSDVAECSPDKILLCNICSLREASTA